MYWLNGGCNGSGDSERRRGKEKRVETTLIGNSPTMKNMVILDFYICRSSLIQMNLWPRFSWIFNETNGCESKMLMNLRLFYCLLAIQTQHTIKSHGCSLAGLQHSERSFFFVWGAVKCQLTSQLSYVFGCLATDSSIFGCVLVESQRYLQFVWMRAIVKAAKWKINHWAQSFCIGKMNSIQIIENWAVYRSVDSQKVKVYRIFDENINTVCLPKKIRLFFFHLHSDYIANITESDETKLFEFLAKCDNCEQLFIYDDLFKHVCQYDDQKNFIFDEEVERSLWHDSPLRRMYLENNRQTQQILEQLKGGTKESKTTTRKSHHVCSFCHRMYVHASGLARHMETHNSNDQYTSRSGAHQKKSSSHVESSAAVHRCLICGRIYGVANLCSAHVKAAHPDFGRNEDNSENIENIDGATMTEKVLLDVLYKCEYCDGSYASIASLMKHQIVHDVTIGFECCECEIGSRNLKFILNHRKNECPFEMYGREAKINLKQHFVCDKCEAVFDSLPQLYEHR